MKEKTRYKITTFNVFSTTDHRHLTKLIPSAKLANFQVTIMNGMFESKSCQLSTVSTKEHLLIQNTIFHNVILVINTFSSRYPQLGPKSGKVICHKESAKYSSPTV